MFESIRIKLDRRNISKIGSMLLFLSEILGPVSLWRFMGTVAMGMAVHMKPELCVCCCFWLWPLGKQLPLGKKRQMVPRWTIHTTTCPPAPKSCSLFPWSFLLAFKNKMFTVILQKFTKLIRKDRGEFCTLGRSCP